MIQLPNVKKQSNMSLVWLRNAKRDDEPAVSFVGTNAGY